MTKTDNPAQVWRVIAIIVIAVLVATIGTGVQDDREREATIIACRTALQYADESFGYVIDTASDVLSLARLAGNASDDFRWSLWRDDVKVASDKLTAVSPGLRRYGDAPARAKADCYEL